MITAIFWTVSVYAALVPPRAYEVDVALSIGKDRPEKIRMVVSPGKPATISSLRRGKEGIFLDIVALEKEPGALLFELQLGRTGPNGARVLLGTPKVLASVGEKAALSVEAKAADAPESYRLELTARPSPRP
jgi:hypothetical protein